MIDYLTNKTYRAGAYVRLSIEDENKDDESLSIKNQRAFIKDFALKNNIEIYDYYVDDGYSGGNFDRPGFKRLINDIENGIIDCVITKDMSRLGREFLETGNYIFKYFPEKDVRYIAILENYDTFKPNGVEDIIPFKAVMNDMYIKDISKKIIGVRHKMMEKGLFVGSSVPYGYKRSEEDNKKLVIDEYAAKIVQRIFNMKEEGITEPMIARTLTNEGILPPNVYKGIKLNKTTYTTNLWKPDAIKTILKNEAYIGNLIQGKYQRVSLKSKKKKLLPKSKWIIAEGALPQIIDKKLFDSVNMPKTKTDIRYRQYDYLLKGLVVCPDCGNTMIVRRVKKNKESENVKTIYVCRTYAKYRNNVCSMHYFREDKLNELVINEIRRVLLNHSKDVDMGKQYETSICSLNLIENYDKELSVVREKLITIDKAISELYKDKATGLINNDEFFGIKTELEKDRKVCEKKIEDFELLLAKYKNNFSDETIRNNYINEFLKSKSPSKKIIQTLVNKIEINENKSIKIYFNFKLDEAVYG